MEIGLSFEAFSFVAYSIITVVLEPLLSRGKVSSESSDVPIPLLMFPDC